MTNISNRIIGVDESGKGDFFGSLVVAAIMIPDEDLHLLEALGVRDSKKIADKKLIGIDEVLREKFEYALVVLRPEEYNDRYDKIRNLNKLLAWGHAEAIEKVISKTDVTGAISDKFGKTELITGELRSRGIDISLKQEVRGERHPQVAAASILARAGFLREMDYLSDIAGIELPRGAAAHVDEAGRQVCSIGGVELLGKVAKTHFKNFVRATSPQLF